MIHVARYGNDDKNTGACLDIIMILSLSNRNAALISFQTLEGSLCHLDVDGPLLNRQLNLSESNRVLIVLC